MAHPTNQPPIPIPDPKSNCVQAYVDGVSFPSCEGTLPVRLLSRRYLREGRRSGLIGREPDGFGERESPQHKSCKSGRGEGHTDGEGGGRGACKGRAEGWVCALAAMTIGTVATGRKEETEVSMASVLFWRLTVSFWPPCLPWQVSAVDDLFCSAVVFRTNYP